MRVYMLSDKPQLYEFDFCYKKTTGIDFESSVGVHSDADSPEDWENGKAEIFLTFESRTRKYEDADGTNRIFKGTEVTIRIEKGLAQKLMEELMLVLE